MRMREISLVLLSVLTAVSAVAQVPRAFVSAKNGNDMNPCSLTSPCRGFQRAINVVAVGGEVIPLDSGGYGTFGIAQSMSISVPPGIYAGVTNTAPNTAAVEIGATGPLSVALRGLTITNLAGNMAIHITAVNNCTTRIDSCTLDGNGAADTGVWAAGPGSTIVA